MKYVPDGKGRVGQIQDGLSQANYVNASYTAPGGINTLTLGNGLTETLSWNDRVQLTGLTVAPQSGPAALALGLYPCTGLATSCANGNTGRVQTQTISLPGFSATQNYTYDAVNRLHTAGEGTGSWSQVYNYDASGNMYVTPGSSFIGSFTPTATTNFDVQNRLQLQNLSYDASGNQTIETLGVPRNTFDADGRLTAIAIGATTTTYVYDGEGQRVAKLTTVNGALTGRVVYVHDASGNLAAEYDFDGNGNPVTAQSPCGTPTCYVSVDQLRSTRLVTDNAGNVAKRYDFSPFGTEIFAGTGGRTAGMKYQTSADGFSPKFTGQFRGAADTEGGLDYFHMRYYSPEQGRFVGVDPENAGADAANPQSWNGYSYVSNDPLTYTDPTGEGIFGDIFGFIGSFFGNAVFPGLGSLIGWGVGSVADVATGQSVSPPGFNFGGAIFGSIAGSVNTGQPWNEQLPAGVGSVGALNTGTVFGSGNTGPFIFSVIDVQGNVSDWNIARAYLMRVTVMAKIIRELEKPGKKYTLKINDPHWDNRYFPDINTITWQSRVAGVCRPSGTMSPALRLGHELAHAAGYPGGTDATEMRLINGPEHQAAKALGECVRNEWDFYKGFIVQSPTQH